MRVGRQLLLQLTGTVVTVVLLFILAHSRTEPRTLYRVLLLLLLLLHLALRMMNVEGAGVAAAVIPGHVVTHTTRLRLLLRLMVDAADSVLPVVQTTPTAPQVTGRVHARRQALLLRHPERGLNARHHRLLLR